MKQNEFGETLFVLYSGQARVEFVNSKGALKQLATGEGGDVFGEMSLLTGERRRASVVALTEVRVVVVGKAALADVLRDDLSSLEALTGIMKERLEALGGRLEISSQPNQGTRLVAHIPVQEAQVVK